MNIDKNTGLLVIGGQSGNSGNSGGGGGGGGGDTPPPATGGTEFYKCAAVYGPREVACFVFSGCPEAAANGTYLPTEFTTEDWEGNEQTVYSNGGGWYYCYTDYDMTWGLTTDYTSGGLRYSGSLGSSWWDNSTWEEVPGMTGVESTTMVDTDVPKTWDGYKAVQSGGVCTFESEATAGLTYTDVKPEKYQIYSADAAVKIDWMPEDFPTANLILFAPLTNDLETAEIGGAIKHSSTAELGTLNGKQCAVFTNSGDGVNIKMDGAISSGDFTFFLQFAISSHNQGDVFFVKKDGGGEYGLQAVSNDNRKLKLDGSSYEHAITQNQWYSFLWKRKNGEMNLFYDDELKDKFTNETTFFSQLSLGRDWFYGGIRNVLIYDRALTEAEIAKLNDKFGA